MDQKVWVNPRDGGELILALPRTTVKGHLPWRLAPNFRLDRASQERRLARHGWRIAPGCPLTSNAHQLLKLIDPHGRRRQLSWNKWQQRVEARARKGLPAQTRIRRLRRVG